MLVRYTVIMFYRECLYIHRLYITFEIMNEKLFSGLFFKLTVNIMFYLNKLKLM